MHGRFCSPSLELSERFLKLLFARKAADAYIHVWSRTTHDSFWSPTISGLVQFLASHPDQDIYVSNTLHNKQALSTHELWATTAIGLVGMAAHIDILGPQRAVLQWPAEERVVAFTALQTLQPIPTVVLSTGDGCIVWWLFNRVHALSTSMGVHYGTEVAGRLRRHIGTICNRFQLYAEISCAAMTMTQIAGRWNMQVTPPYLVDIVNHTGPIYTDIHALRDAMLE